MLLCKGACPLVYSMDKLINNSKAGGLTKDEVEEHLTLVKNTFLFIQIFSGMNQKRREFIN